MQEERAQEITEDFFTLENYRKISSSNEERKKQEDAVKDYIKNHINDLDMQNRIIENIKKIQEKNPQYFDYFAPLFFYYLHQSLTVNNQVKKAIQNLITQLDMNASSTAFAKTIVEHAEYTKNPQLFLTHVAQLKKVELIKHMIKEKLIQTEVLIRTLIWSASETDMLLAIRIFEDLKKQTPLTDKFAKSLLKLIVKGSGVYPFFSEMANNKDVIPKEDQQTFDSFLISIKNKKEVLKALIIKITRKACRKENPQVLILLVQKIKIYEKSLPIFEWSSEIIKNAQNPTEKSYASLHETAEKEEENKKSKETRKNINYINTLLTILAAAETIENIQDIAKINEALNSALTIIFSDDQKFNEEEFLQKVFLFGIENKLTDELQNLWIKLTPYRDKEQIMKIIEKKIQNEKQNSIDKILSFLQENSSKDYKTLVKENLNMSFQNKNLNLYLSLLNLYPDLAKPETIIRLFDFPKEQFNNKTQDICFKLGSTFYANQKPEYALMILTLAARTEEDSYINKLIYQIYKSILGIQELDTTGNIKSLFIDNNVKNQWIFVDKIFKNLGKEDGEKLLAFLNEKTGVEWEKVIREMAAASSKQKINSFSFFGREKPEQENASKNNDLTALLNNAETRILPKIKDAEYQQLIEKIRELISANKDQKEPDIKTVQYIIDFRIKPDMKIKQAGLYNFISALKGKLKKEGAPTQQSNNKPS